MTRMRGVWVTKRGEQERSTRQAQARQSALQLTETLGGNIQFMRQEPASPSGADPLLQQQAKDLFLKDVGDLLSQNQDVAITYQALRSRRT